MTTKDKAILYARDAKERDPTRLIAIYRIGAAWMYTGQSLSVVQNLYKREVKDWQIVEASEWT